MNKNFLIEKYNKLPEWLRWILFLPISFFGSIILGFLFVGIAENAGIFEFILAIIHPVAVQVSFLYLVFNTIPKRKFKSLIIFITLRSIFLLFFIAQPVINYLGAEMLYDKRFFIELAGEVVTLIVSVFLYRELRKYYKDKNN